MKVFVHISDDSLYLGNGGVRSNAYLAQSCHEMGYETYVFGQKDKLDWEAFDWLSFPRLDFDIIPRSFLFKQKGDIRIISSWLNRLMVGQEHLRYGLDLAKLRYLERDELARGKYSGVARFVQKNFATIGITNRALIPFYSRMRFSKVIPIENWFRRDLFYYKPNKKVPGTVGFQGGKVRKRELETQGQRVIWCEGNQARVAGRMRRAEFFVYANPPKRSVTLYSGEGFGNMLYEAMACGCIVLATRHNGTEYLKDTIPLVHDVPEAITLIKSLSEQKKREIREKSLVLVEERFRLNDKKKRNIERFLE